MAYARARAEIEAAAGDLVAGDFETAGLIDQIVASTLF